MAHERTHRFFDRRLFDYGPPILQSLTLEVTVDQDTNCLKDFLADSTEQAKVGEFLKSAEAKLEELTKAVDQEEENTAVRVQISLTNGRIRTREFARFRNISSRATRIGSIIWRMRFAKR